MLELATKPNQRNGDSPPPRDVVNILLVDDEARNLDVLESILESPDHHLVRAQTAEETLLALIERDFAAIVLDIQMPGMSGFELAKLIKQRKRNRHIPIIFLTAYFQESQDVLSGYGVGAVDYLTKPVDPQILRSKVGVFVELFRTTRALTKVNSRLQQEIAERERTQEVLRKANAELELRVQAGTSDLVRAIRDLRESEERYRLILENALEYAIFTVDASGCVSTWNSGAARILGFEAQEILGRPVDVLFTAEDRENGILAKEMARALANGRSQHEHWHLRKDGSSFWASGLFMALTGENGQASGFLKILRDRTSRKLVEEHARETEILRATEREQRRISQDLHDGLGQQLAGISCLSDTLKKDLAEQGSPQAADAAKISKFLDDAVALTRSLARGLQPVAPEPYGLMAALDDLASRISDLFKVACHLVCPRPVRIRDNLAATHFFRIAQEAVTNSIKHGRAQEIKIGLSATSGRIVLSVSDNGVGLNLSTRRRKGLGLRIMRHRAGAMGGTIKLRRNDAGGADMICTVKRSGARKAAW
jgi:PAS domain S-box-containing protein